MDLPRDEIAFRKRYEHLVLERAITTVFRPGNRIYPHRRGYRLGEVVTARIIERVGSDKHRIPPEFNSHKVRVKISSIICLPVDTLTREDFVGSSPDVYDIQSLIDHLHYIYLTPIDAFDRKVTRIGLTYLE